MPAWIMWLACSLLLLARALLAAAESALYGVSDLRAKELLEHHPSGGRRVLRQKTEREATAATLRVGMVMSGFFAAALAALAPPHVIADRVGSTWHWLVAPLLSALVAGLLGTLLEVAFRSMANAAPEQWALTLSPLTALLRRCIFPPARLMVGGLNLLLRPFGTRVRFERPPPPLEELEQMLAVQAAQSEEVDRGAPELIRSIFELSDKRCRDVMVPRTEVVAVDLTTPPDEILQLLAEESHSRIPVYRGDPDHIAGVLHARDLIPLLQHPELIVLPDVVRPPNYVPWMKPIGDLLREMQQHRIHMAIVVDEYGGFMGIVTLEDILREIVGDIGDEFEEEERLFEKQPDGSYLVEASLEPEEFNQAFGTSLPVDEFDTLGGYLASRSGSIPDVGDRFIVEGWQVVVTAKDGPRLEQVRVVKLKSTAPPPNKEKESRSVS
jgi:CBS domain containing-hemolysin-like protein